MAESKILVYNLDDLVISPEQIQETKVFRKAVVRKDYEIIIPKDESDILIRDLQNTPYRKMAETLVQFYLDVEPNIDYLSQNLYLTQYLEKSIFSIPWLVPVVRDQKLVYKRKQEGPMTILQSSDDIIEFQKNILGYANAAESQVIMEYQHNYRALDPINVTNHSGASVFRLTRNIGKVDGEVDGEVDGDLADLTEKDLQYRGSYGDRKITQMIEKKKTARKEVIVGKTDVDQVIGEPLQVVGFVKLPRNYPESISNSDWFSNAEVKVLPGKLEKILREFLPTVDEILRNFNTTGVTDIRVIFEAMSWYGHLPQSMTPANRNLIAEIININLAEIETMVYEKTNRLEYPYLEKELLGSRGSGILSDQVLENLAIMEYQIPFDRYPHLFHRYLQLIGQIDNGNIWFSLINPANGAMEIAQAVQKYGIMIKYREIKNDLLFSYQNLLNRTVPDPSLYASLTDNPLDSVIEQQQEKRDKIFWYQYFKKSFPDRTETFFLYHGKRIGCQHEYDRLYQMFEDTSDPYPYGKRYTRITPNDGIICGFCGDTLREEDEIIDQGYDVRGQKINTYDNEGQLKEESNIDLFFKKGKTEIIATGEKMVRQWIDISEKKYTDRQEKVLKYKILRTYEKVILDAKFFYGLQQNPNKLIQTKDREFGEYLVNKYKITDFNKFPNNIFLTQLFKFFYSLSSIYELILQRLAVFLVILNWHIIQEDSIYLNVQAILNTYTPEQIGKVFLDYNLHGRTQILNMKEIKTSRKEKTENTDSFFNLFVENSSQKQAANQSVAEFHKMLRDEYQEFRDRLLYTPNVHGQIFNGVNPLEHEIVQIFSDYQVSKGGLSTVDYLKENFTKYWKIWKSEHEREVKFIEENARISLIPQRGVLTDVPRGIRPLFDRYLAQRKFLLTRQLEQIYLDFINDNVYNLADVANVSSSDQLLMKKMYYLNKLNCGDWSNLEDLGFISMDGEVERMDLIIKYKEELSIIENQMEAGNMEHQYITYTGGVLVRDYQPNIYLIYHMIYRPIDLIKKAMDDGEKYPFSIIKKPVLPVRVIPRIAENDLPKKNKLFRDLSFLGKIDSFLNMLGEIGYLPDLENFAHHVYQVVNGQMNGTSNCNSRGEIKFPYPTEDKFEDDFKVYEKDLYMQSKMQMGNLKNYIISYLRHHVKLMSRIKNRNDMFKFGLERYLELFDFEDFNEAFAGFNEEEDDELGRIFTNDEICNLIVGDMDNYAKHSEIISNLQTIFITDIVRQLRYIRTRAGRFVKGHKKKRSDEPDASQIFSLFVKIFFMEIAEQEKVNNVDFNHTMINQNFVNKMMWHKMDTAEKRSELEWAMLRHHLNVEEVKLNFDTIGESTTIDNIDPAEVDTLDMEDEDDAEYNDNFDLTNV